MSEDKGGEMKETCSCERGAEIRQKLNVKGEWEKKLQKMGKKKYFQGHVGMGRGKYFFQCFPLGAPESANPA